MAYGKAEEIIVVRKWKVEKYMEQIYVQTEDLSVGYHKKVLLSDIALKVNKGEILVLIGPNGAGKSTIIKNLIKEMSPIGGNIYIKSFLLINAKNNDFSLGLILGKKDDVIEVFNWVNSKEIIDKIKDIKLNHTTTMILFNS